MDNYRIKEINEQGEQKPILNFKAKDWYVSKVDGKIHNIYHSVDKVEPKFHEGDFILNGDVTDDGKPEIFRVLKVCDTWYDVENIYDSRHTIITFKQEYSCRVWNTIQDAKKGDILQANKCTIIFDSLTKDIVGNTVISSWYHCDTETFYGIGTCKPDLWLTEGVVPATKEQRDILFQKMKESGYFWDVEKKELKEIDNEEVNGEDYGIDSLWHAQRILEKTLGSVDGYQSDDGILEHKCAISAVKKLYEQKPAEWSKQQVVNALTKWLTEKIAPLHKKSLDGTLTERYEMFEAALLEMRSFVNSSDFQIGKDTSAEWSEEDEKFVVDTVNFLCGAQNQYSLRTERTIRIRECIDWLKSLKERVQPLPTQSICGKNRCRNRYKELKKISQEYPLTSNECYEPAWTERMKGYLTLS